MGMNRCLIDDGTRNKITFHKEYDQSAENSFGIACIYYTVTLDLPNLHSFDTSSVHDSQWKMHNDN